MPAPTDVVAATADDDLRPLVVDSSSLSSLSDSIEPVSSSPPSSSSFLVGVSVVTGDEDRLVCEDDDSATGCMTGWRRLVEDEN